MENDINKILETKKSWRTAQRRIQDRRQKDGSPDDRKILADTLRSGRQQKINHLKYCTCSICELHGNPHQPFWLKFLRKIGLILILVCLFAGCAQAEMIAGHDVQAWASAIGRAENSHAHPYGIMVKYHHTSPRQACINTVRHQYRLWQKSCHLGHPDAFLMWLARHYAPIGAKNDPIGLNVNWAKNVQWYLK